MIPLYAPIPLFSSPFLSLLLEHPTLLTYTLDRFDSCFKLILPYSRLAGHITSASRLTHRRYTCTVPQPLAPGNMSSQSDAAEIHRILSRDREIQRRDSNPAASPCDTPDTTDVYHVGALFGSRKGSYPTYPDDVEVSEDEASIQPDASASRARQAYQLQRPQRALQHNLPPTPALTPTQKSSYLSRSEFARLNNETSAKGRRGSRHSK